MKQNAKLALIKINGSNINLDEVLLHKIQDDVMHVTETHFGHLNHASVGFTRDGHWYCCTINVQIGNLKVIVAEALAPDCHQAFDQALARIGRQLLQRKRRVADRNRVQVSAPALA
jgi:ribosomal subunit interface protein